MAQRTAVVLDVGGVLVDGDYRRLARSLLDDEAEIDHFLTEVLGPEFHEERDLGVPMHESAQRWSERHPEHAAAITGFCERFPEMWVGEVPGASELVADLRTAEVPLYALTNWGFETWPLACERFPFLTSFDGVLVSAHIGLTKPDPRIYDECCSRFGLRPDECFFVDDVPANVDAAARAGFAAVVFTSHADLRARLAEHGILLATSAPGAPR
jgi:2-haloacid dehalogenase